ncbi:MAG: GNAT family protein [Bacteroidota bacterium]
MLARAYRIETERLVIRCYQPQDAELLKRSIDESLEHLLPWMTWAKNEPESIQVKRERIRRFRGEFDLGLDYTFGIFSRDEQQLIGSTGLHTRIGKNAREIGYWINANYVQQGYATETVSALIKVSFEIEELERIEIRIIPENRASQRIPKKLGFLYEGTLKNRMADTEGQARDMMIWTMFRSDYLRGDHADFPCQAFNIADEQILG